MYDNLHCCSTVSVIVRIDYKINAKKSQRKKYKENWTCIYLKFGTAVAACIGGGTVYGNGNFAATAGFSKSIFAVICVCFYFFFLC